jgi:hypothetical protein
MPSLGKMKSSSVAVGGMVDGAIGAAVSAYRMPRWVTGYALPPLPTMVTVFQSIRALVADAFLTSRLIP